MKVIALEVRVLHAPEAGIEDVGIPHRPHPRSMPRLPPCGAAMAQWRLDLPRFFGPVVT